MKRILIMIFIGFLVVGCTQYGIIDAYSEIVDTTSYQPYRYETEDIDEYAQDDTDNKYLNNSDIELYQTEDEYVPEILIEYIPEWYYIYAPLMHAYLAFENGEPADDIIQSTIIEWRHFFFPARREHGGILVFALHDINGSGTPELIIGFTNPIYDPDSRFIRVCNVYTIVDGVPRRIVESWITDEVHKIHTRSIWHNEGNIVEITTEYSLSLDGILIEEYSIEFAIGDCINYHFEDGDILSESGESLNDTPAELVWRRLSEFDPVILFAGT